MSFKSPKNVMSAVAICVVATSSPSFAADTPDAFLEYVASTGKQYVDTGIRAKSGVYAKMKMRWTVISGNYYRTFLGAKKGNDNFLLCHAQSTLYWFCGYGTYSYNFPSGGPIDPLVAGDTATDFEVASEFTADGRYSITVDGQGATLTPASGGTAIGALDTGLNLWVFARNTDGAVGLPAPSRCYYLQIWTNDVNGVYTLARDFKPCIKDGVAGLYDKVSGEIFYSGASTALEAGPEIDSLPPGATELEYVASSGQRYVDTGVRARSGVKAEVCVQWGKKENQVFVGARVNNGVQFIMCQQYNGNFMHNYGTTSNNVNNSESVGVSATLNTKHVMVTGGTFDGTYWKASGSVDGTAWSSSRNYKPGDTGANLYLFAQNVVGKSCNAYPNSLARCYYLKLWQTNGVDTTTLDLVRDFRPCKDPSGTVALYDMVSKSYFYPNTGTLTAGPEVSDADPVWTGAAGTYALDTAANWSTGKVPTSADAVTIPLADGETTFTTSSALEFGDVSLIGTGTATIPANVTMASLSVAPYATAKFSAKPGVANGGLKGGGTIILDPGAGTTITMTTDNTDFSGLAVIASGTVKFGNRHSFGFGGLTNSDVTKTTAGTATVRVKGGATLDVLNGNIQNWTGRRCTGVILEEGAALVSSSKYADPDGVAVATPLTLEGDATMSNTGKGFNFGTRSYGDHVYATLNLGDNTLTLAGSMTNCMTVCDTKGDGTIDVTEGVLMLRGGGRLNSRQIFLTNGLVRVRSGTKLYVAKGSGNTVATVRNLLLEGEATTVDANNVLKVTGSISGHGAGAVFKPDGEGYLTISDSLSGTMTLDFSDADLSSGKSIPLFRVGSAELLPGEDDVAFAGGCPTGWGLSGTADGLGYNLVSKGMTIYVR